MIESITISVGLTLVVFFGASIVGLIGLMILLNRWYWRLTHKILVGIPLGLLVVALSFGLALTSLWLAIKFKLIKLKILPPIERIERPTLTKPELE